ncbi:divalent-cation tolerance protein CutA [Streptomyces sp. BI20]|uniref:divalent-cation tolerance protein CutA n=1 Tax=Streptomyces sp. BI20 TaxID=3403460 RepID=UPI003C713840
MTTDVVVAQTTVDGEPSARELARGAVEARLAACAHVDGPLTAVYRWEGRTATDTEWRISFKTTRARLPELTRWLHEEHPYDLPQWLVLPTAAASDGYATWVASEVGDFGDLTDATDGTDPTDPTGAGD